MMEIGRRNGKYVREATYSVTEIDGAPIEIRFQLATNGVVCITDVNDKPVILTKAA